MIPLWAVAVVAGAAVFVAARRGASSSGDAPDAPAASGDAPAASTIFGLGTLGFARNVLATDLGRVQGQRATDAQTGYVGGVAVPRVYVSPTSQFSRGPWSDVGDRTWYQVQVPAGAIPWHNQGDNALAVYGFGPVQRVVTDADGIVWVLAPAPSAQNDSGSRAADRDYLAASQGDGHHRIANAMRAEHESTGRTSVISGALWRLNWPRIVKDSAGQWVYAGIGAAAVAQVRRMNEGERAAWLDASVEARRSSAPWVA